MEGFGAGYFGGHTVPTIFGCTQHTSHASHLHAVSQLSVYVYFIFNTLGNAPKREFEGIIQEGGPKRRTLDGNAFIPHGNWRGLHDLSA